MTTQLREAIARLRRSLLFSRDDDLRLVLDALEAHLKPASKFDKRSYQREYMRKRREALRTSNRRRG